MRFWDVLIFFVWVLGELLCIRWANGLAKNSPVEFALRLQVMLCGLGAAARGDSCRLICLGIVAFALLWDLWTANRKIDDGDLINIVTLPQHLHCFDQTDSDHLNFGASRYFFAKTKVYKNYRKSCLKLFSREISLLRNLLISQKLYYFVLDVKSKCFLV